MQQRSSPPETTGTAGTGSAAVAEQMRQIEAEVRSCTRCRLCEGRTHAVPGEGALDAVVLFVGEGPGADEDRLGRPFVGRSGQFLTRAIEHVGLRRDEVYITNVVKCRPPNNRDPLPEELAACEAYLLRQIELINPRIIVTLGRFSMERWFPGARITQIHGQIKNIGRGRVAMAMFHPAAALRHEQWRQAFERDMRKLPALVARARAADEAAARGEKLPAGVPHPGDPDYVAPEDGPSEDATSAERSDGDEESAPDQLSLL